MLAHLNSSGINLQNNLKYHFTISSKTDKFHMIHQASVPLGVYPFTHVLEKNYNKKVLPSYLNY